MPGANVATDPSVFTTNNVYLPAAIAGVVNVIDVAFVTLTTDACVFNTKTDMPLANPLPLIVIVCPPAVVVFAPDGYDVELAVFPLGYTMLVIFATVAAVFDIFANDTEPGAMLVVPIAPFPITYPVARISAITSPYTVLSGWLYF